MRMPSGTVRRRRVLVVDPDAVYRAGLEEPLQTVLWTVLPCPDLETAEETLGWFEIDAIWTERDGLPLLRVLDPSIERVVVTSSARPDDLPRGTHWFSKRETHAAVQHLATLEPVEREKAARR